MDKNHYSVRILWENVPKAVSPAHKALVEMAIRHEIPAVVRNRWARLRKPAGSTRDERKAAAKLLREVVKHINRSRKDKGFSLASTQPDNVRYVYYKDTVECVYDDELMLNETPWTISDPDDRAKRVCLRLQVTWPGAMGPTAKKKTAKKKTAKKT